MITSVIINARPDAIKAQGTLSIPPVPRTLGHHSVLLYSRICYTILPTAHEVICNNGVRHRRTIPTYNPNMTAVC